MTPVLMTLAGLRVYESVLAVDRRQVRFPRTKKRRVQKKWRKDERNWSSTPAAYELYGLGLIAHPDIVARLRERAEGAVDSMQSFTDAAFLWGAK